LKSLALISNISNIEEKNKILDFCNFENFEIDIFTDNNNFSYIKEIIKKKFISKIIILEPKLLDKDLFGFCKKMIFFEKSQVLIYCSSYDYPDPFQNAIRYLPYFGKNPERISKIKESINNKASRGQVLGKVPFGYKKTSSGFFEINLDESNIVKSLFSIFLETNSLIKTVKRINTLSKKKFTSQSVNHLLRNDFYVGVYRRYNVVIPNSHQRLISNEIYANVANILNSKPVSKTYNKNFWLGILFCNICRNKLKISYHKNNWKNNGKIISKNYKYYFCLHIDTPFYNNKKLSINFNKLNLLLKNKYSLKKISNKIYNESYIYKIVSELVNEKIQITEFINQFELFDYHLNNSDKLIKQIYVDKLNSEIVLSSK
tara:strand:+ start:758 stop:1879 length:1122 start_codon:yes stop_codon:yes gene_type:complete